MASDITLSKGVRSNLLSLQSTAELLNRTQERLSTGKKVNSALDNPINFFTSAGLSSRANDLSRLLDSVGNAVQTIAAADKGISSITKLIESAQATARQALTASEGTTTYALSQTGSVTVTADTAATGTGTTTISADVAAINSTNTFASFSGSLQAEELATLSLDTTTIATMADGDSFSFVHNGTTYSFTNDEGANSATPTPPAYEFDGTHAGLVSVLNGLFGSSGTVFQGTVTDNGTSIDITTEAGDTTSFSSLVSDADVALTSTAYVAADTITLNDGTNTETFTYVSSGANASNGTFTSLNDLRDAINHGNSAVSGLLTASNDAGYLRLVGDTGAATITATGNVATDFGFSGTYNSTANAYNATLAAQAGNSMLVTIGSTNTTVNLTSSSTRASVLSALGAIGSFSGNNLVLTAGNNSDSISVSGTAAAALGFGTGNVSFSPTNSQIAGFTGQMTFQVGSGAVQTIEFGNGASGEITTRAALNTRLSQISSALGNVTLSINGSNQLSVTSTDDENVTIGGTAAASFGLTANTYAPTPTTTANATRTSLQADFNNLLSQITTLAEDASYNGVNLLDGDDLSVIFNEDGSSSLAIDGVDFSASGLGLTAVSGAGFQSNTQVNASLAQLDSATQTLRTQASRFGSNLSIVQTRQDFTKNLISVLQTGADNLVLADTNEEGANMLALQTRQQLSSVALSLASQADQNVLRLF